MKTIIKTDVIIIGAGPTGLALACQFIRYGIDFIIVEKKQGVTNYSKAVGVHARTLEIYEQIGLAERAVKEGQIAGKARFLEAGKVRGEVDISRVGEGLSQYPFMLIFEQSKNEHLLDDYIRAHGKHVLWQTSLVQFSQNDEGVTAEIKLPSGAQTVEAKYLVGCDGAKSPVRHSLGLAFEGSTFERIFYVADVRIDWEFPHDALHISLGQKSSVAFFPMFGENRYRIVGAFPEEFAKDEGEVLYEEIEQRIKEESEIELDISEVNWFSTYKVHTRHVERFSSGRCFLAGDAAHVHTPMGGQGMNTGIQDAYNLAWKMALVLKGAADERILETYNEERLENAKNLLGTTDRMFNLASGSDWLLGFVRTRIFPPLAKYILDFNAFKKRFFPLLSQIGINYRDFSLSEHAGDENFEVKAGDRMPYFLVDGKSIYDRLREPKFHLLVFSDGEQAYQTIRDEIAADYAGLVDFSVVPILPPVAETFGTEQPFSVLLRPDNYIGFVSPEHSAETLRVYLKKFIGNTGNLKRLPEQNLLQAAAEARL